MPSGTSFDQSDCNVLKGMFLYPARRHILITESGAGHKSHSKPFTLPLLMRDLPINLSAS